MVIKLDAHELERRFAWAARVESEGDRVLGSDRDCVEWGKLISHVEKQMRVPQAVMRVASMLSELGVRPASEMESSWIHWEGRGWLRVRLSSGKALFLWEPSSGVVAQFTDAAEAAAEVSRWVGKRKTRSKQAKKEGEQ